ncbi:hypothetical protein D3C74_505260 [compost metagenome]
MFLDSRGINNFPTGVSLYSVSTETNLHILLQTHDKQKAYPYIGDSEKQTDSRQSARSKPNSSFGI